MIQLVHVQNGQFANHFQKGDFSITCHWDLHWSQFAKERTGNNTQAGSSPIKIT